MYEVLLKIHRQAASYKVLEIIPLLDTINLFGIQIFKLYESEMGIFVVLIFLEQLSRSV